ncbi:hypothetical protein ACLQ3K_25795 [Tsukamurella sp. DT100]|uniref:hypothetical protein n=1 Tax=Tsukamurella sp. DT100 TaxID=3393415 RepID=UPI003CF24F92
MTPHRLDAMPTPNQVRMTGQILGQIRCYDAGFPRPDDAMVIAWAKAFAVHNLTKLDLEAGVTSLFADEQRDRDRVLPQDVIRYSRAVRRDRQERETAGERAAREQAIDAKVRTAIGPVVARVGALDRPATRAVPAPARGRMDPAKRAEIEAELDAIAARKST